LTYKYTFNFKVRIVGGKGGFGATLRSQKPKHPQTMNFDACRDLSGRRIRHVRATQDLEQWHKERNEEDKKIEEELDEYKKHEKEINHAIRSNDANKDAMISKYKSQMDVAANNISNGVLLGKAKLKRKHKELLEMPGNDRKNNIQMDIEGESHEQKGNYDMEEMFFQSSKRKVKRFKIEENIEKEFKEDKDIPEESLIIRLSEPQEEDRSLLLVNQKVDIVKVGKELPVEEPVVNVDKDADILVKVAIQIPKEDKLKAIYEVLEKVANVDELRKYYTTEQVKDSLVLLG
jgi:hypothetical protein